MKVKFELYRSKYPDQMVIVGEVSHDIEDTILPVLDNYIAKLIIDYMRSLEIVKRNGLAYIGNTKIKEIIIENTDTLSLNEEGFKMYLDGLYKDVKLTWQKDS